MRADDTAIRVVHDLTQAAWFGGSLMGATAIDAATRAVPEPTARMDVADNAWVAWHRFRTPAVLAHLAAGAALTFTNKGRLAGQRGAATTTILRAVATGAAIGSELYAQVLGRRLSESAHEPVAGSTTPGEDTDEETAALQRRLRKVQWLTVGLTATIVALGARMGEQQRPTNVITGALDRIGMAA